MSDLLEKEAQIVLSEIDAVAEDIITIVSEKNFSAASELLERNWLIGQRIAIDPLYGKHKRGQVSFRQRVAESLEKKGCSWRDRTILYFVEFYEWEPKSFQDALMKCNTGDKAPAWRDVVHLYLPSGKQEEKEKKVEEPCNHKCPRHCK